MTGAWLGRAVDGAWRALVGTPRTGFHLAVGLLGMGLLWAGSLPGVPFVPLLGLAWLLALGALVWTGKLVAHLLHRRRGTARAAAGRWFLLAPAGGVLVVALLVSGVAFDVRWALSEVAFDAAVVAASDPAGVADDAPGRVGRYRVGLYRVLGEPHVIGEAVLFHHPLGGGLFDDAGFAHLPDGPTRDVEASFEALRTEHIDGPWYRWWSSW